MTSKKSITFLVRKIFINNMNSWFSNFIIEEFRTDHLPDAKIKNIFLGTMEPNGAPLPKLFEAKETFINLGYNYTQEVFDNDIIIFNLDSANLPEVEFVVRGLQNIKLTKEKILILISNVMTWANTPLKTFTEEEKNAENFNEEEVPEILDTDEIKKSNEKIDEEKNDEEKKSDKESSTKKILENSDDKLNNDLSKKVSEKKNEEDKNNKITNNNIDQNNANNTNIKIIDQTPSNKNKNEDNDNNEEESEEENNISDESNSKETEKPKLKTYYYKESEYQKRIPNSKYNYYNIIETLALDNKNPLLKTYVICPGFIYGC